MLDLLKITAVIVLDVIQALSNAQTGLLHACHARLASIQTLLERQRVPFVLLVSCLPLEASLHQTAKHASQASMKYSRSRPT